MFYALLLIVYSAQIGVFAAQDLLLFFFIWELELVPVYLLISIWGGNKRLYAATKFILYTAAGSIFILVAALAIAFYGDTVTNVYSTTTSNTSASAIARCCSVNSSLRPKARKKNKDISMVC